MFTSTSCQYISDTHNRDTNMNRRIFARNIPSAPLQPNLDVRPIPTKYVVLPIVNGYPEPPPILTPPIPTFNISEVFNPGTRAGPWSGFAANIDAESCLRTKAHQVYNNPDNIYMPDSSDRVYPQPISSRHRVANNSAGSVPASYSSINFTPTTTQRELPNVGHQLFHNSTRTQQMDYTM